ncbi:MAG: putative GABA permease [Burkholderia plantarii]|nr:MAG: putative GABA permease [Burkholderia plantarii]
MATWIFALGITSVLTATNLFSVKNYGEFEFWFALIKVVAIIAFLGVGGAAILGILPGSGVSGAARLVNNGGFMPHGVGAVLAAILTTMFSFLGTEIVTIAAAESDNPKQQIVRATNSVIWRISLFYLGSIFVVAALVPWNDPLLATHGSYQRAMELIGIPHAKAIIDVIVLISVASCLNSALYTASRMVFSLASRGDAPAALRKTDRSGTPRTAVLASTAFGFLTVIANYVMPEQVFGFLLATSGAIALLVYLVIAISQLRMRKSLDASGEALTLRMWCFPWLTWVVILFISGVLVVMLMQEAHRIEVGATALLALGVVVASWLNRRSRAASARVAGTRAASQAR